MVVPVPWKFIVVVKVGNQKIARIEQAPCRKVLRHKGNSVGVHITVGWNSKFATGEEWEDLLVLIVGICQNGVDRHGRDGSGDGTNSCKAYRGVSGFAYLFTNYPDVRESNYFCLHLIYLVY